MSGYILPKLQARIAEFLNTYRLGVDFGEAAGGIALVHRNEILHAETFIDFHETTLEQRRTLRRGRRTRRSKKMRLARLRSWVLRQKVNGSRLPDPYLVMREHRFQTKPDLYRQKGKDPVSSPSWVQAAIHGNVDAQGFVCALTHIFQKRGYKWDDRGLAELSDAELKDFLASSRIPSDELENEIAKEIARREDNPNDPARGRTKVSSAEFRHLLQGARCRLQEPRKAEHRTVKERELRAVVAGFGKVAGLNEATILRWQNELVGILNKALREVRFENRLKTGCSWCGKPTPRKSKVREEAYKAAVHNLRVRESFRIRKLTPDELKSFSDWWSDRERAPGADKIKKHLKKLGSQEKMARQLHDLLKGQAEGRASLCRTCLKLAAEGKTMKEAGLEWQTLAVRKAPNPCREQHDARVMQRIEDVLFIHNKMGSDAWRYGPISYITLEVPKLVTTDLKKDQMAERKVFSLRERLHQETAGICLYTGETVTPDGMQIDHIFPESRGGPDLRDVNLVCSCKAANDDKGNRTPWEWFGGDNNKWQEFSARVEKLPLPQRKKELLLSKESEFPDNPTPLAHVGARPRQFIAAMREMFAKYKVPQPLFHLKTGDEYIEGIKSGHAFIQRVEGSLTTRLRRSWLFQADQTKRNFPTKQRTDLANHAQDAAILAACPPHTWREQIFCFVAKRPSENPAKKGQLVHVGGLAFPELAPDWAEFDANRRKPILHVLGRERLSWKKSFADQTFWQDPDDLEASKLKKHKPVADLTPDSAKAVVDVQLKRGFAELTQKLDLKNKQAAPEDTLRMVFGRTRRVTVSSQKGGTLVQIQPSDGPMRKVQIKPGSTAVIIWRSDKGNIGLSVVLHPSIAKFAPSSIVPPLPNGAKVLDRWERHKIIELPASSEHPKGFYRVKEFSEGDIKLLHESAMPVEIARRIGVNDGTKPAERKLGKIELAKIFARV